MKRKKVRKQEAKKIAWKKIGFGLSLLLALVFFLIRGAESKIQSGDTMPSKDEMNAFWDAKMEKIILRVADGQYEKVPEINSHHQVLKSRLVRRYHQAIVIGKCTRFNESSRSVDAGSSMENGKPTVAFYIPAAMLSYNKLVKQYGVNEGEEVFERSMVISFLHELDHLAFNPAIKNEMPDFDELVAAEAQAWAQTCEHAIRPMVERGLIVGQADKTFYAQWVKALRDEQSPAWHNYIRQAYQVVAP